MPSLSSTPGVVSFEEARRIVEGHARRVREAVVKSGNFDTVDLSEARGRVLGETLLADRDFPPFARATRDGYAVRAADVKRVPVRLEVVGEIKAGSSADRFRLGAGQAISIMTGAPLPAGADAVVMVEYTTVSSAVDSRDSDPNAPQNAMLGNGTHSSLGGASRARFIHVERSVECGENFVPRGAEAGAGEALVEAGRRLDHSLIAIAASAGKNRVQLFRQPRVAVLSTGDEIVEVEATPGPAQIRNSNSYSLAAQIEEAGADAVRLAIAPDEPRRLRELILEGLNCDLLILTGGVSMGKYDLVEQVLGELGAEFYFTGAKIQPGKPVVFGTCRIETDRSNPNAAQNATLGWNAQGNRNADISRVGAPAVHSRYFLGLPGNPVSTMVTFRLFAEPLIAALAGALPASLVFLSARLKADVRTKIGLTRFLPAVISGEFADAEVELAAWQGSGDIAALARANCFLVVPPDRERIAAGESVAVMTR
ncbi:MAG TPA: molybdopterin molybdotransferase MoeA [Terriglobales bacterium]|nr:molybdopterin molybdotransferase MoeA [Terriglobales bacterium]